MRAGVDVVAHTTPQFGPWDDAVLAAIEAADVALVPTLKVWQHHLRDEPASARARSASTSTGQLRAWRDAGGTVVFGTDAGGMNDYDPSDEYALMAEAGMTFREILAALTTTPAAIIGGPAPTGRIAPGQPADLVVLDGDPSQNVRALADVLSTRNRRSVPADLARHLARHDPTHGPSRLADVPGTSSETPDTESWNRLTGS